MDANTDCHAERPNGKIQTRSRRRSLPVERLRVTVQCLLTEPSLILDITLRYDKPGDCVNSQCRLISKS
jgi:hypothetical protein